MKLWVDDRRPAPPGWVWVRSYETAVEIIEHEGEDITEVDLDHDLCERHYHGDYSDGRTGDDVLQFLLESGYRPVIKLHTTNPEGLDRMTARLESYD
jgi:hypothetical protein